MKSFADGKVEVGTDEDVSLKKASWSKGRLTGISSVEIHYNEARLIIEGTGEYWQSDDYEVDFGRKTPTIITRRIQKKINTYDAFMCIYSVDKSMYIKVASFASDMGNTRNHIARIPDKNIGKWLTLEYNLKKDQIIYSYQENRI